MKRLILIKILFLITVLFFYGCTGPHYVYEQSQVLDDGPLKERYINGLKNEYPEKFNMAHRALLTVYGYQYDFTGCVSVDGKTGFKGAAFGDLGGKLFELSSEKGKRMIIFKPDRIPDGPLIDGMIDDLEFLYLEKDFSRAFLVGWSDMHTDLVNPVREGIADVYMFRKNNAFPDEALSIKNGKIFRVVRFTDYQCIQGEPEKLVPSRIMVHNYRWNYQVEIKLLKLFPAIKAADNGKK